MLETALTKFAAGLAILSLLLVQPGFAAGKGQQRSFESPHAAVQAMLDALKQRDEKALLDIFGREHADDVIGTDRTAARIAWEKVYKAASEMYVLREDDTDHLVLVIGPDAWPSPIPLVKAEGRWKFDTDAGIDEIINRRVGRNELNAIDVCNAFIDAQRLYASADRDADDVLEYAQRLSSTPGMKDGLYWENVAGEGEELSPFGPFVADAWDYLESREPSEPFKGYYFRILTRQGANPPGGAYSYVINGNMIAGFALLAYPADWGHSGIMTFACSHHGKIFERNLGANTLDIAKAIRAFDPNDTWRKVEK